MISKILKQVLYLLSLFLFVSIVSAANLTVQELIDGFDHDFLIEGTGDPTINVTNQTDYMFDDDGDGVNDTLVINLTNGGTTDSNFTFIIEVLDKNGIVINTTTKPINSTDKFANINFDTGLLSQTKFNYSIRIYDINDTLVFRKYKIETQTYLTYETGTNVTLITDESINNNFIRINLTIDSSQAITTNVTVTLAFNSSTISATEEKTLSVGVQKVSIDFDNETIKSTHHNSNFTLDTVVVGNKVFDFDQNTSIYNYEDFAKTSYIKTIADGRIDEDNNNLSEFLEINFTVVVKTANNYTISYDLYDQFDNFVINISNNETLAVGTQNLQTLINGSEIYKTKIDGPYVLSFAKLHVGNDTKDIIFDAHTTNQSFYTDYERPPLPDLKVTINSSFDPTTNITNITVNLSNIGQAQAFNVFLDIFDNVTYENNRSLAFMVIDESIIYEFNITNSTNATLVTVIADFDNLVDESNESNNIVQNTEVVVSLAIESLNTLHTNGTLKIFEFVIFNDGDTIVKDIQWQFDTDDSNVINSTINISSLSSKEKTFVYLQYNYSSKGSYNVKVNATGLTTSSDTLSATVNIGDLIISSFTNMSRENFDVIFEFQAQNNGADNISDINWSLDTKDGTVISATKLFNLTPSEIMLGYAAYTYSSSGTFNPSVTVTSASLTDTESITIDVPGLEITGLSVLNESGTKRIFEFIIENTLLTNLTNVNWTFDTKNNTIINATSTVILQPNEELFVYLDYNFTGIGTFNVNATAKNGSLIDSRNLSVTTT